jgi:hypothetical protein
MKIISGYKIKNINILLYSSTLIALTLAVYSLKPEYSLAGDSLNKYIQTKSLILQSFRTEQIYYPAKNIDSDFQYYPLHHVINVKERRISVFPVFLAVVSAPLILLADPSGIFFVSILLMFLSLIVLNYYWGLSNKVFIFSVLCTPLFVHSFGFFDVSIGNITVILALSLYLKGFPGRSEWLRFFIAGLLMGLSVWFRMEGILIVISIIVSSMLVYGFKYYFSLSRFMFIIGFAIIAVLYIGFNFIDYGNLLGPRYIINESGIFSLSDKLEAMKSLFLFGGIRLGFFGYTPAFIGVLTVLFIPKYRRQLLLDENFLLYFSVIFLILAGLFSPNDSNIDWGTRYFSQAILPVTILLQALFRIFSQTENRNTRILTYLFYFLFVFSFIVTVQAYRFLKNTSKQLEMIQKEFHKSEYDILLFQNRVLAGHIGLEYFRTKTVLAENASDLRHLLKNIKSTSSGKRIAFYEFIVPEQYRSIKELDTLKDKESYFKILDGELNCMNTKDMHYTSVKMCEIP